MKIVILKCVLNESNMDYKMNSISKRLESDAIIFSLIVFKFFETRLLQVIKSDQKIKSNQLSFISDKDSCILKV